MVNRTGKGKARGDERLSALLSALQQESSMSSQYLRSEMEASQVEALKRYFGDPYGDEVEGRSRVTTREVFETIEWLRPDLRRVFTSGDRVAEFEGKSAEGDQHAEQAGDYVNFLFMVDNPGETVLDEFICDGLLQRFGIMAAEWKDAEFAPAQEVSGLNSVQAEQLMQAAQQGQIQLEGQDVEQGQPDEAHPDGLFFSFKMRRLTQDAKPDIFSIAPEDFRIAARSVSVDTARYCGDIVRMMTGEAVKKWPDYEEEIKAGGQEDGFDNDERRAERFRDIENWDSSVDARGEGESQEVEIMREYIRYDLDGDGYPELIRTYRVGDCLLEHDEVDEHIYTDWTPIRVPHRWAGLSIPDIAADIQRTKTVLLRSALDCAYQSANPRVAYDKGADVDLDALLTVRPGVAIGTSGSPADKLMPFQVPDLSQGALNMMQWMDRVAESRTGVTRQAQGFDPDLLHDTAKGVELLQNAASIRKEEMARNLAEALQRFFRKLYRLVHKHQNNARAVKIAGQWGSVDPRAWEADLRCTVSTGLGTGAKEKQLVLWQMMQGDQVAWIQGFGPGQPYGPRPSNVYALAREKYRTIGIKNAERFLGQEPPPDWVPEPPPNPEAAKIQAEQQLEQAKLQAQGQIEQMKAQSAQQQTIIQAQKDMEVAVAQQRDEMVRVQFDAANNERVAANENAKTMLEAQRTQLEHDRETQRMASEHQIQMLTLQLKSRELDIKERELEVRQQEAAAQRAEAQADREHESAENKQDRKANGSAKQ